MSRSTQIQATVPTTRETAVIRLATLPLLLVGIAGWIFLGKLGTSGARPLIAVAIAVTLAGVLVMIRRDFNERFLDRLRDPSPPNRAIIAGILTLLAGIYFFQTALWQGRQFGPVLHDEHCYIIQTRMLAHGKLWMPRHELGDFFDSFHLITDRVYASKYGPGTALFGVPAIWAGLDPWVTPLVLTSLSIGLCYLLLAELMDGLAALLGALMLPALSLIRRISLETLSEAPMLLLTLVALLAFLQWRRRNATRWLALMGAAVGWSAITRPADAICLALPLAVGVALHLRGAPWRRWGKTVAVGLLAAAPFLALQLACNNGITGRWTQLPWTYYGERNDPYDSISYAPFDPARRTASIVPEIVKFQDEFTRPAYQAKLATPMPRRILEHVLKPTLEVTLPNPLLLILVPVGLLAAFTRGRWVLAAGVLPLFILIYARHTFFLVHYAAVIAPALIVLVLLGGRAITSALPKGVQLMVSVAIAALVLTTYPQFQPHPAPDEWAFAPILRLIDDRLADLGRKPAIVLFRFDTENGNPHIEPVYNTDVAWPDDAPVIRAHDLGPQRNRQLFDYYARQKPDRAVYLFDLSPATLQQPPQYLGTARDLAAQPPRLAL